VPADWLRAAGRWGSFHTTKASGSRKVILPRYARNRHLGDAFYLWAFAAITASPGARAY
jgi:hypothetical protein